MDLGAVLIFAVLVVALIATRNVGTPAAEPYDWEVDARDHARPHGNVERKGRLMRGDRLAAILIGVILGIGVVVLAGVWVFAEPTPPPVEWTEAR